MTNHLNFRECRQQMHYAENLVRQGKTCPAHMIARIEQAYLDCREAVVAQRLSAALDLI